MNVAPPIIGPLEFEGRSGQLILIEVEDQKDLLFPPFDGKRNLIFTTDWLTVELKKPFDGTDTVVSSCNSVAKIHNIINQFQCEWDFIIIHCIELMNLELSKKVRGSQVKAFISMLCSPKILKGANLIITSTQNEYKLRELSDEFLNLKMQFH